jgi:protein TonB
MRSTLRVVFVAASVAINAVPGVSANDRVYAPGDGVTLPVVVKEVRPTYPPAAQNARIGGAVVLESVVLPDGSVGSVKILKSLHAKQGFDRAAVDAMKRWQFKPGLKDGKPVPVRITTELTFTAR